MVEQSEIITRIAAEIRCISAELPYSKGGASRYALAIDAILVTAGIDIAKFHADRNPNSLANSCVSNILAQDAVIAELKAKIEQLQENMSCVEANGIESK